MKYIIFIVLVLVSGCTAVGVTNTDDPYEKLAQSYQLMSENRPIPAEFNAQDALKIFKEKNDVFGEAEAYYFLGVFYKAKSGWENVDKNEYINKSITYLIKASDTYKSIKENIQASKASFELANAYRGLEDKENYCKHYSNSLSLYTSGTGEHKTFKMNNPNVKSPKELLEFYVNELCPNNA